jgi:hypothetical protein
VGCTGAGKQATEEVLNPFRPFLDMFRLQTDIIDRLVHFMGIVCMVGGDEGGEGHVLSLWNGSSIRVPTEAPRASLST